MAGPETKVGETPDYLTETYWEGHSFLDSCQWSWVPIRVSQRRIEEINREGAGEIGAFLLGAGKISTRIYRPQETFRAHEEKDGVIVRLEREKLIPGGGIQGGYEPAKEFWGVVSSYDLPEGETIGKLLALYEVNGGDIMSRGILRSELPHSVVAHVRMTADNGAKVESLERITDIEIFRSGTPVRERVRRDDRIPNLGILLRPSPQGV